MIAASLCAGPARRSGNWIWLLVLLGWCGLVLADDYAPAAAVASSNLLATRAGMEIIRQGGNAFDAAVAVTAVLAVVEPYSAGLGGGGLWLLHRASDGRQTLIDGRERSPQLTHWHMFRATAPQPAAGPDRRGALYAAIPGIPAGMVHLARHYGRLPLAQTLKPALDYARNGFYVDEAYRSAVTARLEILQRYPETAAIFLERGSVPRPGFWLRQPDLADTLAAVADQGLAGFYQGRVAERLLLGVNKHDGIWTAQDLLGYQIRERDPLVFAYRDLRIVAPPPPSAGGFVLDQALTILAHFDLAAMSSSARAHHVIESLRRAFRDSAAYLGDPDAGPIPLPRLLDPEYLAGLALAIDPDQATPSEVLGDTPGLALAGAQTTHFSILDADGNRVAGTLSSSSAFGSGYTPAGTGVLLNNSMADFVMHGDRPAEVFEANSLQPRKRPLTSMTPLFVESPGRVAILGTPGGSRIISTLLLAVLGFNGDIATGAWLSQPRYHHQYQPDIVEFEPGALSPEEQRQLQERGHRLQEYPGRYGDVQAIVWDRHAVRVDAASDPRGNGSALVTPAGRQGR